MASTLQTTADPNWLSEAQAALPHASLRRIALASLLTLTLGFGGLTGWAATTTVDSAVPATGVVVASGKRKTVTLLEGGLLRELLVREGDRVVAGQVLLRLDDIQAQAARSQANTQYWAAVARAARLAAEAQDERALTPDAALASAAADPAVAAAVSAERHQFQVRWTAFDASVEVQNRKIAGEQAQLGALRAQIAAYGTRFSLVQEELGGVDYLLARGFATKPHQLELRRSEAELRGQIGQLANQLTQAEQAIAQTQLETITAAATRRADISRERAETQAALADAQQRLRAAEDQLQKREITAPEPGTVTDLRFFTVGSSVIAGQPILDLVPDGQKLLIEASVAPHEVEHLAVGQRVNIRLSAYKAHRIPVITGRLAYVGADRQMDPSNQPVFLVRAEVDPDALRDQHGVVLLPGMPADVMILNGSRSVLSFLISPITDSMFHAMSEE